MSQIIKISKKVKMETNEVEGSDNFEEGQITAMMPVPEPLMNPMAGPGLVVTYSQIDVNGYNPKTRSDRGDLIGGRMKDRPLLRMSLKDTLWDGQYRDASCARYLNVDTVEEFSRQCIGVNECILADLPGETAKNSDCSAARTRMKHPHRHSHFYSTSLQYTRRRLISVHLWWKKMLGNSFPISDDMLRESWPFLISCDQGYMQRNGHLKMAKTLCVNPNCLSPDLNEIPKLIELIIFQIENLSLLDPFLALVFPGCSFDDIKPLFRIEKNNTMHTEAYFEENICFGAKKIWLEYEINNGVGTTGDVQGRYPSGSRTPLLAAMPDSSEMSDQCDQVSTITNYQARTISKKKKTPATSGRLKRSRYDSESEESKVEEMPEEDKEAETEEIHAARVMNTWATQGSFKGWGGSFPPEYGCSVIPE